MNELSLITPPDPFIILLFIFLIIILAVSDQVNNKAVLFVGEMRTPDGIGMQRNAENSCVEFFFSWNGRPNQFTATARTGWLLIYL
jgi:hypothetical protein